MEHKHYHHTLYLTNYFLFTTMLAISLGGGDETLAHRSLHTFLSSDVAAHSRSRQRHWPAASA
jgi:hypothetical protein